jgi:hypothetical protein
MPTAVPGGMTQFPYCMAWKRLMRGLRWTEPKPRRRPACCLVLFARYHLGWKSSLLSLRTPVKYGSFSSSTQVGILLGSGIASVSSA